MDWSEVAGNMKVKQVLTTGEVARICHVAPRTVSKWFDSGKLKGYRIPGSRDRRIPLAQLLSFMRAHGMPLSELEGNHIRVLVVDADAAAGDAVAESLRHADRYEAHTASSDFSAGVRAGNLQPHVVLLDVISPSINAAEILRNLRANTSLAATRIVAVAGALTKAQREALLRDGFDAVLCKPFATDDVVRLLEDQTDFVS